MRMLLSAAALVLLATPALAICPSPPDNEDTGYSANATERALCLARELAADTEQQNFNRQIEGQYDQLRMQIERQQKMNEAVQFNHQFGTSFGQNL